MSQWGEFQGRIEDDRLVTGQGLYVADIALGRTAHAVVVRAQLRSCNWIILQVVSFVRATFLTPGRGRGG